MAHRLEQFKLSNFWLRALSALVLAPLVFVVTWLGGWTFQLMVLGAAILGVREWVRMVAPGSDPWPLYLSYGAVTVVVAVVVLGGAWPALAVVGVLTVVTFVGVARKAGRDRLVIAFGVPYIACSVIAMIWLRSDPAGGLALILYLLATVWATDIGAFLVGSTVGGRRLAPSISPRKTWAGLIGGMICAGLAGAVVAVVAGAQRPVLAALLGAGLAIAEQAGDLFESAVKRRYNVKDSGALIPGHGGLLDRIDGLIAVSPVFALFHATVGTSIAWW
ncbi:MAG: phosphatidate cytidylyltransferase [Azospirillum sp.]|nr:phosphatidate cytidylyltransferase [Azospirillum sp.]